MQNTKTKQNHFLKTEFFNCLELKENKGRLRLKSWHPAIDFNSTTKIYSLLM